MVRSAMKCESCGRDVSNDATYCPYCNYHFTMNGVAHTVPEPGEIRETDGWAVATFIFGILVFVPLVFLAVIPSALIARLRLKKSPHKQGKGLMIAGLLIAFFSFVIQIVAALFIVTVYIVSSSQAGKEVGNIFRNTQIAQERYAFQQLRAAMENYIIDHGTYPAPTEDFRFDKDTFPREKKDSQPYFIPLDVSPYRYNTDGSGWYIVAFTPAGATEYVDVSKYDGHPEQFPGLDLIYDPTNGTASRGDLWMVGPNQWPEGTKPIGGFE